MVLLLSFGRSHLGHSDMFRDFQFAKGQKELQCCLISGASLSYRGSLQNHSLTYLSCILNWLLQKSALRRKCAVCKIVVHTACIEQLEKVRERHLLANVFTATTCEDLVSISNFKNNGFKKQKQKLWVQYDYQSNNEKALYRPFILLSSWV